MTPEISRRCRACGAAARAGGRFCPQCGERLDAAPSGGGDAAGANTIADATPNAGASNNVSANANAAEASKPRAPEEFAGAFRRPSAAAPPPPAAEEIEGVGAARGESKRAERVAPPAPVVETPATSAPAAEKRAVEAQSSAAAEGGRGRRAAAVRESLRTRSTRVRDASMGVIEEASEDTGLRFVLISLAFFLLFLLLLLLNSLLK